MKLTAAIRRKLARIERHKREAARLIDEVEIDMGIDRTLDDGAWYWGSHVDEKRTMSVAELESLLQAYLELKSQ